MNQNLILIMILLLARVGVSGDGRVLTYFIVVFVPFMIIIMLQGRDVHEAAVEYCEEQKKEKYVIDQIYGWYITEAFMKSNTPYVERITIKIIRGIHSIHAGPLLCD